jgi:molybdenum cofactor synthesis domain-containing protein
MPDAAIVIIGNEILTGKFADENAPFLIGRLRAMGVVLRRVVVIPDEVDVIAAEVRGASASADHVFTTGGVGPTHDDVTFEGVAAAFGVGCARHPELAALVERHLGPQAPAAAYRMAEVPEGSELWWDGDVRFPLVVTRNVAIFPGVPSLVRRKFDAVAHRFGGTPVLCRRLRTLATEPVIADTLTAAATRWPSVAIGSYPRFETRPHTVIVTMEGRDAAALEACEAYLLAHVPDAEPIAV